MKNLLVILCLVILLTSTGFAEPKRVFIDTDIGSDVDDAIALLTILGSGQVEVVGISTVNGKTRQRAEIVLRLLELANRPNIPIGAGVGSTLLRQKQPRNWDKQLAQHLDREPSGSLSGEHGVDLLIRKVHENPGVTVLAIGPLTNVAVAMIKDPTIIPEIGQLVIVGGAIHLPAATEKGSIFVDYKSEYNLNSDPDAARLVFESGVPILMSGLNPALQVTVDRHDIAEWRQAGTPVAQWISNRVEERLVSHQNPETHLGDVLGAVLTYDESAATVKTLPIHVEMWGDTLRTVIDPTGSGRPLRVALDVAQSRFYRNFEQAMGRILSREVPGP